MPKSRTVEANGLRFHVLEEGDGDRLALCLHGFPELAYSWRHQMPVLAKLGYRVWAPDLRGYGKTERPEGIKNYTIETLIEDVRGLANAAGVEKITLIGHDWGGAISWGTAIYHPELIDRLIIMNMPHPILFQKALRTWKQMKRSWYIAFFQLPVIPERYLTANHAYRVAASFVDMAVDRSRFPDEVLKVYRDAASQPGAARAMVNYYRAAFRGGGLRRQDPQRVKRPLEMPTLLIWGEQDTALGIETTRGTERYVKDLTLRYIPDASHWVQQEAPEVVNAMLQAWLGEQEVPEAKDVEYEVRLSD